MADPWIKFYPTDWRSDPALRLCSRAARGTWIDMLSIMHEATPYGELRVNGVILDAHGLAKLLGESAEDIAADLADLEAHGVFSRRRNGAIYSRRMEKDQIKRSKLRENGKKGGNPALCNRSEIPSLDNQQDITTEARSQIPDIREEKKENVKSETGVSDSARPSRKKGRQKYPETFERLWRMWEPRRPNQSKAAAFEEWRKFDEEHQQAIEIASPDYFAACQREEIALLHLERFIRKRRFEAFVEVCDDGEAEGEHANGNGSGRPSAGSGSDHPGHGGMGRLECPQAEQGDFIGMDEPARKAAPGVLGDEPVATGRLPERGDVAEWGPVSLSEGLGLTDRRAAVDARGYADRAPARSGRHAATRH